ncbi:MAG: hypothetical protein HOH70_06210 [Halieaceae bacterium]|jgi:uncharacterized OB-fold protein|nr:hypothetical protein [Halieaceae bacterium]
MKTDQVPVIPGLFELNNSSGVHLVGARCNTCRELYFPTTQTCRNPKCARDDLESVWLALNGTLYSYTIQYYQPPALFRVDNWEPYAIGLIDLDDGVRVSGILSGIAFEDIRIGDRVTLGALPLYIDEHGVQRMTYAFFKLDLAASHGAVAQ